jgi:hypothetical protein
MLRPASNPSWSIPMFVPSNLTVTHTGFSMRDYNSLSFSEYSCLSLLLLSSIICIMGFEIAVPNSSTEGHLAGFSTSSGLLNSFLDLDFGFSGLTPEFSGTS